MSVTNGLLQPAQAQATDVQAAIARAMLPARTAERVGEFVLRDAQVETVAQIRAALRAHGGALVADAAGSGKTLLGLAVAEEYADVLLVAPAALRAQWERAARRAGITLRIVSLESLSRGQAPAAAPLIIVDEAHQLRNPSTRRYRALAELARNSRLLLLSATPVVNRARDRDALLALFLGSRRSRDAQLLAQVVIRRVARTATTGAIRRIAPLASASDVAGLGARLDALPPAFPAADGAAATALLRLSLAFAWASSLAALDAALRRRQQRGQVLAEELEAGRWPSRHQLTAWLHGDDATQLALPLLPASAGDAAPAEALPVLRRHLAAVSELRGTIADAVAADITTRADAMRALLRRESPRRVLLLAHHAVTVRALYAELRQEPGVVAIVGTRVYAAAGRWSRDEVLATLGARATPWSPQDPRGVRLLLATDILAEGVELQGCATLLHGDRAWTPARLEQRVGRIAREGQREVVHVGGFRVPRDAERLLRLRDRIAQKRQARHDALAVTAAEVRLLEALRAWLPQQSRRAQSLARETANLAASITTAPAASSGSAMIAAVASAQCGFLALLSSDGGATHRLVGGAHRDGRWRVVEGAAALTRLVRAAGTPTDVHPSCVRTARAVLQRWQRSAEARAAVEDASSLPSGTLRALLRRLDCWIGTRPLREREAAAKSVQQLRRQLAELRGAGAEAVLTAALRSSAPELLLDTLQQLVAGTSPERDAPRPLSLCALLILRRLPRDPAPPSACSENAAPR